MRAGKFSMQRFVTTEKTSGKTSLETGIAPAHEAVDQTREIPQSCDERACAQRQRSSGGGDTGSRRQIITRHACAGGLSKLLPVYHPLRLS